MEAQRFPTDYDGIVVGAPANYWPRLLASDLQTVQAAAEKAGGWVSREKLAAVSKAALNTCHASDGVIDNPGSCKFDPASLLCKSGESQSCLTQSELATLREIYAGLFDSAGNSIYPGFPPGTEASWSQAKMGPAQGRFAEASTYPFPTGFFGNLVFGNAAWNFRGVSPLDALNKAVNSPAGRAVYADNPDLAAFRAAGGKLIQYHGWSDPAIPAGASIKYYESVAAQMSGVGSIRAFYRLFLAPGMGHCGGGAGPNAVGAAFGLPPSNRDPAHDVVSAVARWVEDGVAPETITATLYRDNDPAQGIAAQRPWCVYPATARLEGQGDRREANSYKCQPPH